MESISSSSSSHIHLHHRNLIRPQLSSSSNPSIITFPYRFSTLRPLRFCGLKTSNNNNNGGGGGGSQQDASDLLRKPAVEVKEDVIDSSKDGESDYYEDDGGKRREDGWIDWEDQILEDTVPLVGFVRMILHSGKYASGERLSPEHERTILERLLPYHPKVRRKLDVALVTSRLVTIQILKAQDVCSL